MKIKAELTNLAEQKDGFKLIAYYKGFFWTLSNYIDAYQSLSTEIIQADQEKFIETNKEKIVNGITKVT